MQAVKRRFREWFCREWFFVGLVTLMLGAVLLLGIGFRASEVDASEKSIDRERVLDRALEDYASALAEPEREARRDGFVRAYLGFSALFEDGVTTAPLLTNLGNAALQAGRMGEAVLAYRRAIDVDPGAGKARQNLDHLRRQLPGGVPRPGPAEGASPPILERVFSPVIWSAIAALSFVVFAAALAVSVRWQEGAWRGVALLAAVVWAVIVGSFVYDSVAIESEWAVVTADEAMARSADSALAPLAWPDPLPAGVEVRLVESREGWTRVRLSNGRDVWLRESNLTRVRAEPDSRSRPRSQ